MLKGFLLGVCVDIHMLKGFLLGVGVTLALTPFIPDIEYRIRMFLINCACSLMSDEEKSRMDAAAQDETYEGMITPADIDRNGHANNARFIRELCFSRRRHFVRLGIWKILDREGLNMFVIAQTIRYRKELKLFQRYKIFSKILAVSDEERCLYLESRFVTDGFVAAVHVCKYKIVSKKDIRLKASQILAEAGLPSLPSTCPFVDSWDAANAISSRELNPLKP